MREAAEVADRDVGQMEMRGRDAAGHRHTTTLGGTDQVEACGGRHLADVKPRTGVLGQHQVARDRQRLGDRGGGGQAKPGRGFACGRHAPAVSPPSSACVTTAMSRSRA